MKKFVTVLICLLTMAPPALPAMAADAPADGGEGNGAAEALNAEWQYYKAVPDYSSGYWLDEAGVLTVGLVDEAGREEVLAIVGNVPVNFEEHVYSYNELWNIQLAIEPFMNENVGIMTVGVNVRDNVTEVGIDMEVPGAEGFVEKMLARYGGRVAFKDKTGLTLDYVKGEASSAAQAAVPGRGLPPQTVVTLLCVIGLGGAFWLLARSRRMVRQVQTADGGAAATPPVTRKETEAAVRRSSARTDTTLYDIMKKLEE